MAPTLTKFTPSKLLKILFTYGNNLMSHPLTIFSSSTRAKDYKTGSKPLSYRRYEIDSQLQIVNSINYFKG